jgi:hypothetical protein
LLDALPESGPTKAATPYPSRAVQVGSHQGPKDIKTFADPAALLVADLFIVFERLVNEHARLLSSADISASAENVAGPTGLHFGIAALDRRLQL